MKKFWAAAAALIAVTITAVQAQAPEAPRLNYAAHRKLGWRLTCQAWTFREMSAFETLDTIQELGVRYVQFYPGQKFSKEKPEAKLDHNMSPELITELKAKLQATNI